jgi:hypothetical protein
MKLCNHCEEAYSVCDFCANFRFNGEDIGSKHGIAYVDKGCCVVHFIKCDPADDICDWYECRLIDKYGEKIDE